MKRIKVFLSTITILLSGISFALGKLQITVINVGQGDAILIRCPEGNHEMLIDSGDTKYPGSSSSFKSYMKKHQALNNPIECVIATHPHSDHIGNMNWVLNTYHVNKYVDNGFTANTLTYKKIMNTISTNNITYIRAKDGKNAPDVDFCPLVEVNARILRPKGFIRPSNDPNTRSVVIRVDYKNNSFLFMGDADINEEALLISDRNTNNLLKCEMLKVAHHGSETASSQQFLNIVSPRMAVISCGNPNIGTNIGYKHPRNLIVYSILKRVGPREGKVEEVETYDALSGTWKPVVLDRALYTTNTSGDIIFESDGTLVHRIP